MKQIKNILVLDWFGFVIPIFKKVSFYFIFYFQYLFLLFFVHFLKAFCFYGILFNIMSNLQATQLAFTTQRPENPHFGHQISVLCGTLLQETPKSGGASTVYQRRANHSGTNRKWVWEREGGRQTHRYRILGSTTGHFEEKWNCGVTFYFWHPIGRILWWVSRFVANSCFWYPSESWHFVQFTTFWISSDFSRYPAWCSGNCQLPGRLFHRIGTVKVPSTRQTSYGNGVLDWLVWSLHGKAPRKECWEIWRSIGRYTDVECLL